MAVWGRDCPWRQGHVLTADAAITLGLVGEGETVGSVAVVISHDCDLAQDEDTEPQVEIIVARRIENLDGNYTHAKNARRLHLTFSGAQRVLILDLVATQKEAIAKKMLASFSPADEFRLQRGERLILQRWLAARYRRAAFSDEFDRRLAETGLRERMGKVLRPSSMWIAAVLLDVDDGEEVIRFGPDDPFVIRIYLLYSTIRDPEKAERTATIASTALERAFRDKCVSKKSGRWQNFELVECTPISDEALTVRQAEHMKRWHADHMSLRTDPPHPLPNDE